MLRLPLRFGGEFGAVEGADADGRVLRAARRTVGVVVQLQMLLSVFQHFEPLPQPDFLHFALFETAGASSRTVEAQDTSELCWDCSLAECRSNVLQHSAQAYLARVASRQLLAVFRGRAGRSRTVHYSADAAQARQVSSNERAWRSPLEFDTRRSESQMAAEPARA